MSALGAQLSVPCGRCSQPIRFGEERCSCGEAVTPALKRALEERLKASSSEYREFDLKLARARVLLLVCAIGQLGIGVLLHWFGSRGAAAEAVADESMPVSLMIDGLAAFGFLAAFFISSRHPMRGIALGGVVWFVARLSAWQLVATLSVGGLFFSGVTALILLGGFLAARDAQRLRARLVQEAATPRQSAG